MEKVEKHMETPAKKGMHPLIAIAAVSITLFSLVGIAAVTGLIPASHNQSAQVETPQVQTATPPEAAAKPADTAQAAKAADVAAPPVSAPKPAARKVAAKRAKPVEHLAHPVEERQKMASADAPVLVAQTPPPPGYGSAPPDYAPPPPPPPGYGTPPGYAPPPAVEPPRPICHECGVIESVREVEVKRAAVGPGTVIGGIAGGILGNQVGRGNGRSAMTVLGAIGGAVAGHEIENNTNEAKRYEIAIRFEDGTTQQITQETPPAWRSGDRVRLVNGVITARNRQ